MVTLTPEPSVSVIYGARSGDPHSSLQIWMMSVFYYLQQEYSCLFIIAAYDMHLENIYQINK